MRTVFSACAFLFLWTSSIVAQPGVIAPGENLVTEGIPSIPAALAQVVDRYTNFRAASLEDWHPSKRALLIGTRFGDTAQIHAVEFPGGARTQLTFFVDPANGGSYEPRTGAYFVFSKAAGGNEFYQKYRCELASGSVTLLTDGKSRNTRGVWSNAGDRFAYGSTRRTGRDVDLYVMNPADPKSDRLLAPLPGGAGRRWTGRRTITSSSPASIFPSTKAISGCSMQPAAPRRC